MTIVDLIRLESIEIVVQGCERGNIVEIDKELMAFRVIFG